MENMYFEPKTRWILKSEKFLNTVTGNLLVNGGAIDQRLRLLIKTLAGRDGISVIFTDNAAVEQALIEAVSDGELCRELRVASPAYPAYEPLLGASTATAAACLAEVAQQLGYFDRSNIVNYFTELCKLLKKPFSLRSLHEFLSRHRSGELLSLAMGQGLDTQPLIEAAAGELPLRNILSLLEGEFGFVAADKEEGFSLITVVRQKSDGIVVIRTDANPEMAAAVFAYELRNITNEPFNLIIAESTLLHHDPIAEAICKKKTVTAGTVAIFCENLAAFKEREALQYNIPYQIHLLGGNVSANDLQEALTGLGTYTRFETVRSESTPMRMWFSLERSTTTGKTPYQRPRVLLHECYGKDAVLSSPFEDIIIVTRFVI